MIEGVLTEEFVLEKKKDLMNVLRDCNITIRWLMLHKNAKSKGLREMITSQLKPKDILSLLLKSA